MVKVRYRGDSVPHTETLIRFIFFVLVWISYRGNIVQGPNIESWHRDQQNQNILVTLDLVLTVVYTVLSHEENKQR